MKLHVINPFVSASFSVLESLLGVRPTAGKPSALPATVTSQECNVVAGITGMAQGHAIFGMSAQTARHVAGQMLGLPETALDEMAMSALAELANMIAGNATTKLAAGGLTCDLEPPSILSGPKIPVGALPTPSVVVPLHLGALGVLELTLSIR
jgi:chemotaxis protein CheX